MPVIVCPNCRSEYDVQLKVLEKKIRCKKCGNLFRALARKSAAKSKKKNPMFWPLIGMGVGIFVVIILIVEANIDRSDDSAKADEKKTVQREDPSPKTDQVEDQADQVIRTEREQFCVDFINASIDNNIDKLTQMINFPAYHASLTEADGTFWNDFSETDRIFKKQEYIEQLTGGSEESENFLSGATVEKTLETSCEGGKAHVEVLLRNNRNGRCQQRDFHLVKIGKNWLMASLTLGQPYGGDLDEVADNKPKTLDEKYSRRINPEAEIEKVDLLPDTSEEKKREFERLADDLCSSDRSLSREAKERLITMGKPAIPVVLNLLVDLDFKEMDHVARANKCIGILREITDQSFGFSPGFRSGGDFISMEAALEKSVSLWFGWWRRNKDHWEPTKDKKNKEDW